ncbi:MAG: S-layer homology domain-containing protein [Thermoanaerobaculia bacterium]
MTVAAGAAAAERSSVKSPVATTRQAPDEFGTQDYTVTTIGAGSFTPASNDNSSYPPYLTNIQPSGIYRENKSGTDAHYYATVSVPAGAVIDFVGLRGYAGNGGIIGLQLKLVDRFGAITPVVTLQQPDFYGGTLYNDSPLGFQLIQNAHNLLALDVELNNNDFYAGGGFVWAEIWWKRAVSPPPAVASFIDVPTSNPFFQYIEALAASGITAGCNRTPPQFCPDQPLTRRQMAVFLAKGFGLHWPN